MAWTATVHCFTGCTIGELVGLLASSLLGWSTAPSILLALLLSFLFGYTLSSFPLLRANLPLAKVASVVLLADSLSILTMEAVDNGLMALIPGAMSAGPGESLYWSSMAASFLLAFAAAYPVNLLLLNRGKGHALSHGYHGTDEEPQGWRKLLPNLSGTVLAVLLIGFVLGGLLASLAG